MRRYFQNLLWLESAVAVVAYLTTAVVLLAQIVAREFFTSSIEGGAKVAVFGAIVAGGMGLVIATGENTHLRPTFADRLLPQAWGERFGDLLSVVLYLALAYYAAIFVQQSQAYGDVAEIIRWPLWIVQLVFPYMFLSSALKHLVFCMRPDWKPQPTLKD